PEERRGLEMVVRLLAAMLLLSVASVSAQTPQATLRVTVVDPRNAVIVGATVNVSGADDANRAPIIAPAQTVETGIATISGLAPGRYTIQAEFPGFDKPVLPHVRIPT